jgi:hypothetical protein
MSPGQHSRSVAVATFCQTPVILDLCAGLTRLTLPLAGGKTRGSNLMKDHRQRALNAIRLNERSKVKGHAGR